MRFKIELDPLAIKDLQTAIDYYEEQQRGLGSKFETTVDKHFAALSKNPFFQIRYDAIHCMPIRKFPYMVHFSIDEVSKLVRIIAVLHTSLDPDGNWGER
jgi:toxin ParE1/3/4